MKSIRLGLYLAFATSILGSSGCGATGPEESVSETQEALDIYTWEDLVKLAPGSNYTLRAPIDGKGRTWTPKAFSATFDGGNFRIFNFSINGGGFFSTLTNATVRKLKLVDVTITGGNTTGIGGLATSATNSTIESVAMHVNINNVSANSVGGLLGNMTGGSIYRSYATGSITGSMFYAGGLVGSAYRSGSDGPRAHIYESYAQMTVNPQTPSNWPIISGGVVGYGFEPHINDVYAVGDVTGRGGVGGIIGKVVCAAGAEEQFGLYKTIYRGDVIDRNWSQNDGWSGGVGTFQACAFRMLQNFYDTDEDQSLHHAAHDSIQGYTTEELKSPTSVIGGVYCVEPDVVPGRCGDNTWMSPPWTAGSASQHHGLMNMPGPNPQPRY
jgi:hypothetical protein